MSEEIKAVAENESAESNNFIKQFITEDLAQGGRCEGRFTPVFRRNPTAVCISVTSKRFASTLVWRNILEAYAIFVWTIPTPQRKGKSSLKR